MVPDSEWVKLGAPDPAWSAETERDHWLAHWSAEHDAVCEAFAVGREEVRLELVGYFGAPDSRVAFYLNGAEWDGEQHSHPPASPFTSWVWTKLTGWPTRDRRGQLRAWSEVRHALETHAPLLEHRPRVELDEMLDAVKPSVPDRFRLAWRREPGPKELLTLDVEARSAEGEFHPLPLAHFDPRGIVAADPKRPVLVPDDVARVMAVASTQTRRTRRELGPALTNPAALIPEGVEADLYFDLSEYSERVLGFELVSPRKSPEEVAGSGISWFDGVEEASQNAFVEIIVDSGSAEGSHVIPLATEAEARDLLEDNERALAAGDAMVRAGGRAVPPSERISAQLRPALGIPDPPQPSSAVQQPRGIHAAIVKELDAAPEADSYGTLVDETVVDWDVLASLLREGISLKPHQRRGIAWMHAHLRNGTPGVLLADDMGLGKTLQAAAFLALRATDHPEHRQLIVAPTVLLEIWDAEIEKFFRPGVLSSRLLLHGEALRRAFTNGELNLAAIEQHQLVITNYETLARHQKSLLRVDFDVVVFDEAHNVKNAATLKARAARALKRRFALAMTGTPVETTLSDVWAIYDAAQTGQPRAFGTTAEFDRDYTRRAREGVTALRQRLKYPSSGSSLLRREKREALRDLPPKTIVERRIEMTPTQLEQELGLVTAFGRKRPLAALEGLKKLYQHPSLLESGKVRLTLDAALGVSPKTRLCLDILDEVRARGEKALVFTLRHQMQDLLVQLFKQRFGLPHVHIINGDPRNRRTAQEKIADFSRTDGFDVMILSPIAAGVGLTITAANNVVHYERWWNPAKEDQATDRAYRIGQTRPVTVYYPVLHRPGAPDQGFDVRLHELVERRRAVARDFLAPADELEPSEKDLKGIFAPEGDES